MGADNKVSSYAIPEVVTIAEIESLHDALQSLTESDGPVLDASAVQRVDTAAMQQFLTFKLALQNTNTELAWGECSDVFIASAKQLGLINALGLSDKAS